MEQDEKLKLIAKTLEITDETKVIPSKNLHDFDEWDSFAMILIISMLDKIFNCKITRDDIESFRTVQDILDRMCN